MASIRTFLAIETPPVLRDRAMDLVNKLQVAGADVKWVEPDNLHWTLNFLGDVEQREITRVCRAAAEAVAETAPFLFRCQGAGAFPSPSRPRTVWLGALADSGRDQLVALQAALQRKLGELGYRAENRAFCPHLTIGRVRRGQAGLRELGELIVRHADFEAGEMEVAEVIVFGSRLQKEGPVHDVLATAELLG